jgi:hypothetical protein
VTIDEFAAAFPETPITPEQIACCRYLERQGKRFLYDFGYVNAPALVWDELDRALEPACSACSALEPSASSGLGAGGRAGPRGKHP